MRPMFGALGARPARTSIAFVSRRAEREGRLAVSASPSGSCPSEGAAARQARHGAQRRTAAHRRRSRDVRGPRRRRAASRCEPAAVLPLAQLYHLFEARDRPRAGACFRWPIRLFPAGGFAHSAGLEATSHRGRRRIRSMNLETYAARHLWNVGHAALPFVTATSAPRRNRGDGSPASTRFSRIMSPTARAARRAGRSSGHARASSTHRPSPRSPSASARGDVAAHHAPLFGATLASLASGQSDALGLYLHSALRAMLSAAVRLGVVGPHEAQRIQDRHGATLDAVLAACRGLRASEAANGRRSSMWSPRRTIACMRDSFRAEVRKIMAHDDERDHDHEHRDLHGHHHDHGRHPGLFRDRPPAGRRDYARAILHGRHRRSGGQRQDGAHARALRPPARALESGRRDQRHLHARGRRVLASPPGACRRRGSAPSRPVAVRTPRFARTSATIWTLSNS